MAKYSFEDLQGIMTKLLSPAGCQWDREQTHKSLRPYVIEEAYEVVEAIDEGSMHKLREELGDLLLQIIFHAELAKEAGAFDFGDVVDSVAEKMVRRHPHVFEDAKSITAQEVMVNWDRIKGNEKQHAHRDSLLNYPKGMPALALAQKVQGQAARVGFDWPDVNGPLEKVFEELDEFFEAWQIGDEDAREKEFGDVMFALVNLARFLNIESEAALAGTNRKFIERFRFIEKQANQQKKSLEKMSLEEMDTIWNKAKEYFLKKEGK